jgi:hypothetical protein
MRRTTRLLVILALATAAQAQAPSDHTHEATHTPATLEGWAQGATLYQGLGRFHRSVTTSSAQAQAYFDQGMRFLWAFNHDESTRSFARAAQLDRACAACYWGLALTVGPNYNVPTTEDVRARVAWEALKEAQKHAAATSAVE